MVNGNFRPSSHFEFFVRSVQRTRGKHLVNFEFNFEMSFRVRNKHLFRWGHVPNLLRVQIVFQTVLFRLTTRLDAAGLLIAHEGI